MGQILPTWYTMANPNMDNGMRINPLDQNQAMLIQRNIDANNATAEQQRKIQAARMDNQPNPGASDVPVPVGRAAPMNIPGWHPPMALPAQQPAATDNSPVTLTPGLRNLTNSGSSEKKTTGDTESQNLFMDPEKYNELIKTAMGSQAYKNQAADVAGQKQLLGILAGTRPKTQVDLSPLYLFANQLTGGKVGMPEPTKDVNEKYQEILQKYGKDLTTRQQALNEVPQQYFKNLIEGKSVQNQSDILNNFYNKSQGTTGQVPQLGLSSSIPTNFAIKSNKDYGDAMSGLDKIDAGLNSGNIGQFGTVLFNAAHYLDGASAKSLLTAVRTMVPPTAQGDLTTAANWIQNHPNEIKVPKETLNSIRERVVQSRQALIENYKSQIDNAKSIYQGAGLKGGQDVGAILSPLQNRIAADEGKYPAGVSPQQTKVAEETPLQLLIKKWGAEK